MTRLSARRVSSWIGCLDFGTSYSKFAMVRCKERSELDRDDIRPLAIGDVASNVGPFLLPSIVFVDKEAILFGGRASAAALRAERAGRLAFESPKQYLSTHDPRELDDPLPIEVDPDRRYSPRSLLSLYLAHLLLRAEQSAKAAKLPWMPRLRIARPAWTEERGSWGESVLKNLVRAAFVLMDHTEAFHDRPEGIPHRAASTALQTIRRQQGPEDKTLFELSEGGEATVLEATAVAAASIRPTGRRIVVVADIGGGTSDFGAFMTGLANRNVVAELAGSASVFRQAGDHLDMLLRGFILRQAGYLPDDPSARGASNRLRSRQRANKETLFNEGKLVVELGDLLHEVRLEEFLVDDHVQGFTAGLRAAYDKSLNAALACAQSFSKGALVPIEIMLTGGGHKLSMVRDLAIQPGKPWRYTAAAPDLFDMGDDPDFAMVVRQLAVSIGGAVQDLPTQTAPLRS